MTTARTMSPMDATREWLLERVKLDQKSSRKKTREATVFFVYGCFGIALMRREFSKDQGFKEFILAYLPEHINDWKTLLMIGQHFKYDEVYLGFLDENKYIINVGQREELTGIDIQLKELALKCQTPLDTPKQLQDLFESDRLVAETTAAKDKKKWSKKADESSAPADQTEPEKSDQAAGSDEEPVPGVPSPADINFNKQLQSLIFRVQNYPYVDSAFRDLLRLRPASNWDTVRVGYLKEALLKAEQISKNLWQLLP